MDAVLDNLPLYWQGFRTTLTLTLLSAFFALILGTVLGAFRVSPVPSLRAFGLGLRRAGPQHPAHRWSSSSRSSCCHGSASCSTFFVTAVVALTVYTAAFVCEAVRSGINSVGVGQAEAARSIGLTFGQTLRSVILPQAFRTVDPAAHQRLHRADQEHLDRRRVLRR